MTPSEQDDYATHLPVLELVCALAKPRTALELGVGHHSTPFLLGCVERLTSIETDSEWAARFPDHPDLRLLEPLDIPDPAEFDLVFIDNGSGADQTHRESVREQTIRAILSTEHPIVVIHDAENPRYARVIIESESSFHVFRDETPHTAVVW
jgi:hypothetical protein